MKNLKSFLNIDFLVKDNSSKNWKMILFISMLGRYYDFKWSQCRQKDF